MPTIRLLRRGLLLALTGLSCASSAAAAPPPEPPSPLRTRDLEAWIREVGPDAAQRVAMEQAFDACVDRWLEVREQTVRPAQAKQDAAPADAAAVEARDRAVTRAFESMRAAERTMFDAMRGGGLRAEQIAVVDRLEQARARTRATAVVRGTQLNLPRVPRMKGLPPDTAAAIEARTRAWEQAATPIIDRLALASVDPKATDQTAALARKLVASQRAAVRDIAALLPPPEAASYAESFRRRTLSPAGMNGMRLSSPEELRARLGDTPSAAALDLVRAWETQRTALEEARIDAMLAEPPSPEAISELAAQAAKLDADSVAAIASAAGMPELAQPALQIGFGGEEGSFDLEDLASDGGNVMVFSGGMPDGDMPSGTGAVVVMQSDGAMPAEGGQMIIQSTAIAVVAGEPGEFPQLRAENADPALQASLEVGAATARAMTENAQVALQAQDAQPMDMLPSASFGGTGPRPLSRQDLERIRLWLAVPDAQRAVWDALAEDLMQASAEWVRAAPAPQGPFDLPMPAPGQSVDAYIDAQSARRAELARIEERWFDGLRAGLTGIEPAALDAERARRAIERARACLRGGGPMAGAWISSRPLRLDLDKAATDLSPAGRQASADAMRAWRTQLLADLTAAQTLLDAALKPQMALMQSSMTRADDGSVNASANLTLDERQVEQIERASKPLQEAIARIEASQRAAVEAVAATLPAGDALAFRRATRMQTHPEAYRSQAKVDAAVTRVLAIADLPIDRLEAVSRLAEDYRTRSDALVERSIERTDRSDAALSGLLNAGPGDRGRVAEQAQALRRTDRVRADANYDREELNARTLRRLRALLTPEQAAAAELD